jgi:hypothetical protein
VGTRNRALETKRVTLAAIPPALVTFQGGYTRVSSHSQIDGDYGSLETQRDLQQKTNEEAAHDYNADLVKHNLRDFQEVFNGLTPPEQAEALQCMLNRLLNKACFEKTTLDFIGVFA